MSDVKEFRVYVIRSKNSNKYYIDYSKHKGYICMQLHNMISRYKKNGNNLEKYRDFYSVIALNDLLIEELNGYDLFDDAMNYINEYKKLNDGCINGVRLEDYKFNEDKIICDKVKIDTKEYLKDYYKKNKEKYIERYNNNKEDILVKMKTKYIKKKKNIE
jgi:hypothetical protein